MKRKIYVFACASLVVLGGIFLLTNKKNVPSFSEYRTIAHAMGGYKDTTISNSLEAFNNAYKKGTRVFEVDLIETEDGVLVARHDWMDYLYEKLQQGDSPKSGNPLTLAEFKNLKSNLGFTSITFTDVLDLLKKHKDIYIVTDTKTANQEDAKRVFSKIVKETKSVNESLLDRIVPQIYNREMLSTLNDIHEFEHVLYTLYMEYVPDYEVVKFATENNIDGIVMGEPRFNKEFISNLKNAGVQTYVHTVNDLEQAKFYIDNGVDGVYTDYLLSGELEYEK